MNLKKLSYQDEPINILLGKKSDKIPKEFIFEFEKLYEDHNKILENFNITKGDKTIRILKHEPNKLAILTEVCSGLGDYHAAARLIKLLQTQSPTFQITWVIRGIEGKLEEIPDELKNTDNGALEIHTVCSWEQLSENKHPADARLYAAQGILIFPLFYFSDQESETPESLSAKSFSLIKNLEKKYQTGVFICTEYSSSLDFGSNNAENLKFLSRHDGIFRLKTGLAINELGIFITRQEQDPLLKLLQSKQDITKILFNFQNALDEIKITTYQENNLLFFGYVNKNFPRVSNHSVVNVSNFILICLGIAEKEDEERKWKRNVDIIVPISSNVEFDLKFQNCYMNRYERVILIKREKESITEKVIHHNPNGENVLRIIDLFRFDSHIFQLLVQAAHPFKMGTGNQSFSDLVSCSSIPFYQVVDWTVELAVHYLEIAMTVLPENALAIQYLEYTLQLPFYGPKSTSFFSSIDELVNIVTSKDLLEQFNIIHAHIIEAYNLNKTFPRCLMTVLHHLKYERTVLLARSILAKNPELMAKLVAKFPFSFSWYKPLETQAFGPPSPSQSLLPTPTPI